MSFRDNLINSYCFDDIHLLPKYTEVSSRKNIDLSIELSSNIKKRSLQLKIPLISSPMDTVTSSKMAISMALNGGIGIIHRFMDLDEQLKQIEEVKRYVEYIYTKPYTILYNDTIDSLICKIKHNNVKSYCVVDEDNNFVGIITNRDIKLNVSSTNSNISCHGMNKCTKKEKTIHKHSLMDIVTPLINMNNKICIYHIIIKTEDYLNNNYEKCLLEARLLMNKYKVQKIPVILNITGDIYNIKHNKLYGIITERSIKYYFNNRNKASLDNKGRLCCGAAIGIKYINWEHINTMIDKGLNILCIDVANGYNKNCIDTVKKIRNSYPDLIIMSGNICTSDGLLPLANAGVDCVRIGIGNGSICSTRIKTGIGYGQFSAINEIMDEKIKQNLSIKLICDGGSLGKVGNKMKALACGSTAIMMGRTLACCYESPGIIINRNGKKVKYFRGMASKMASLSKSNDNDNNQTSEGVDGIIEVKGKVSDILDEICGGIRSGLSYLGCDNLDKLYELRYNNNIYWAISSSIGLNESNIRINTL